MTAAHEPGPAVLVVGSINLDLQVAVPTLPRPGETVLATGAGEAPGGKGANQAVAVARAGGDCWMVGAVGADEAGRAMLADLEAAGVRTGAVAVREDVRSGSAVVMVDAAGENSIVVVAGANGSLDAAEVTARSAEVGPVDVVVTQAELSPACVDAAAAVAGERGARFVLNLAPYRSVPRELLRDCDPLVLNEHEATALTAELTRAAVDGAAAPAEGAAGAGSGPLVHGDAHEPTDVLEVLAGCARSVVITLGARGARWASGAERGEVPAPRVQVVDTTGAGDVFVGALAVELARSGRLDEACAAGVAAASAAVCWPGARGTTPHP